jgi:molybdenum cofactor synthesis domain-containing protein
MIRTALLTVDDQDAGEEGAPVREVRRLLAQGPFTEVDYQRVPAEQAVIRAKLRLWADGDRVDLVLTSGGTGLALRDRTPEATRDVIEREVPGLAELMRLIGMHNDRLAALSRATCGVRRGTLIVNLPETSKSVADALEAILGVLPQAIDAIAGEPRSSRIEN